MPKEISKEERERLDAEFEELKKEFAREVQRLKETRSNQSSDKEKPPEDG